MPLTDLLSYGARPSVNGATKRRVDLSRYGKEIESGLPTEVEHRNKAIERQAFFDWEGDRYEQEFKRDAESSWDYQGRPHRPSGFLRECVEVLCEDLYCPGPARKWSEDSGDSLLQQVYADNLIDSLMQGADTLSTLNELAAIQIDAGAGDYAEKPITYRLWGREQLHVWPDPNNANVAEAVVTIDRYDLRTRYRLWSDAEVWTYTTKRADETAGGRVAFKSMDSDPSSPLYTGPHDYGTLPFSLIHYSLPIRSLEVPAIGRYLLKAEIRIDDRLNRLDESIGKHLNPVPVAEGVPTDWKPVVEPMRFIRMPSSGPMIGATGGFEPGTFAKLYFLEAHIDTAGAWDDLLKYINQALQAARVPLKAVAMDEMGVQSGIALIVEHAPLLKRARQRRGPYTVYEGDLAKRTLVCCGNHYGKSELVVAAHNGRLVLGWPQPSIPIPTPDGLQLLVAEVQAGMKSHLQAIMQWNGISRVEALELVEQMATDDADLAAAHPILAEVNVPKPEPEEPGPGENGKKDSDG